MTAILVIVTMIGLSLLWLYVSTQQEQEGKDLDE